MEREKERHDDQVIDLGSVAGETKGSMPSPDPDANHIGTRLGGGGISDD